MTMDSFRNNPRGLTDRVSAMRSQNGQFSQDVIPKDWHVALLMTFTPDPPSITHPWISVPCTRTLITGLLWSTSVGSGFVSVSSVGMAWSGACNLASIACRNHGTRAKSLLIVSVMGQSARASQIGSPSTAFLISGSSEVNDRRILGTLVALAFVTHYWVAFLMPSSSSHSAIFALLRVVT